MLQHVTFLVELAILNIFEEGNDESWSMLGHPIIWRDASKGCPVLVKGMDGFTTLMENLLSFFII